MDTSNRSSYPPQSLLPFLLRQLHSVETVLQHFRCEVLLEERPIAGEDLAGHFRDGDVDEAVRETGAAQLQLVVSLDVARPRDGPDSPGGGAQQADAVRDLHRLQSGHDAPQSPANNQYRHWAVMDWSYSKLLSIRLTSANVTTRLCTG